MPHPSQAVADTISNHTRSREPYEEAIAAIWCDVLGRSEVDVSDDFLTLGDHSLAPSVVARIRGTLGVDISVTDFFEARTVTALAAVLAARSSTTPWAITPRPPDAEPVLSFDQQRLWMESQLLPAVIYNVHGRRRLLGRLDIATLEASIRAIFARHETLRTRFPTVAGKPVQLVDDPDERERVRVEDLTGIDPARADRADLARRLLDEEATTPFDLATGPLLRCLLVKLSDTEHLLGLTMHHIVSDFWSIALFVRELSALYEAGGDVARASLPALPIQYRDYAVWQRGRLAGATLERQVGYWRQHLAGAPPVLALPTAQRRSATQGADADRIQSALSAEETAALHELCREHDASQLMVLLAVLATVLGRWSGQSDVVVGVTVAGRTASATEHLIGFFVNVLPFRVDLSGDPAFTDLLGRVRRVALDGYAHANAPLDVLVDDLRVARDPRRTPLFEVVLNVLGSPEVEQVSGLAVEPMDTRSQYSRYDLSVTAQEAAGALQLKIDFAADRCQPAMVQVLLAHLGTLLREVTADPAKRVSGYSFPATPHDPGEPSPVDRPALHVAVGRQARAGDRIAVVDGDGEWSYRRLDQAADRVAAWLTGRDDRDTGQVGVVRRPAAGFVAALLGCGKAGVSYSVVEADDLDGAGFATLLDTGHADGTVGLNAVLAASTSSDSPLWTDVEDAAAASGQDGDWAVGRFGLHREDRFAALTPGLFGAALSNACHAGGTLVIPDRAVTGDLDGLARWLRANAISVLYGTAPVLRALTARTPSPDLPALRQVFVDNTGGLLPHDVEALRRLSACRVAGVYRVDGDGVPLATYPVPDDWQAGGAPLRIPLGAGVPGRSCRLLHPSGSPAAVGEVAEIRDGSQRTGDLGRRWPDGTVEFVRHVGAEPTVDPLETVATLRDLPEVRDAVVTQRPGSDGGTTLLGYVVGPDPAFGAAAVRRHLVTRLPDYLVPEQLFVLGALPLTPDGDYDLTVLPDAGAESDVAGAYTAPRTPAERQLTGILEELLTIDRVGVHDSFFELGGFSLLASQLTARIWATFNVQLALRDVFESPTVDELAQLIVRTQGEQSGAEDLEALLTEIERSEPAGTMEVAAEPDTAGPAWPAFYERAVDRLRRSAVFTADKPDETPETTACALSHAAAGTPRAVTAGVVLPPPDLSPDQERTLDELVERRVAGEPLAYLTGRGGFMGLEFRTERGALIPRRETELLGGAALRLAGELADAGAPVRVLDLCTGAGNLAVSIAVLEPRARVWAADLEAEAVAVAVRNATLHEVTDRVTVTCGDLFAALDELSPAPGPFDLVVCNPPYMPTDKARNLPVEVGGYEPVAAFDGGDVGLSVLYRVIAEAPGHLVPGGWVAFELGAGMGRVVEKRMAGLGAYDEIRKIADQDGVTRAILARTSR